MEPTNTFAASPIMNAGERELRHPTRDAADIEDTACSASSQPPTVDEVSTQAREASPPPRNAVSPNARRTLLETVVLMTTLCVSSHLPDGPSGLVMNITYKPF